MFHDRKASFKMPPQTVREAFTLQESRRKRALEEQKRRRAERIDSTRQLDILADLSLGGSDDDADAADDPNGGPNIVYEGVGQFAAMLPQSNSSSTDLTPSESTELTTPDVSMGTQEKKRAKNKRKGKGRANEHDQSSESVGQRHQGKLKQGIKKSKPSKWADKCMYAELLEMNEGFNTLGQIPDGIPSDIESGWVVVTPVPVGKRCLAVIHQASGVAGVVSNATLRSRVLGKALMKPFPSTLPPQTILDCILDDNWRDNGILHVLDVLSWKGQELADCETPFRLWWRDTRLSELNSLPPPSNASPIDANTPSGNTKYQFSHPTTFVPIPYHTDTSLAHLASALIPLTRTTRAIPVSIPVLSTSPDDAAMSLDNVAPLVQLETVQAQVLSDGLLLYVAHASYEPGTSPLSSWVPLRAYQTREEQQGAASAAESPLDIFERLIRRRLALGPSAGKVDSVPEVEMAP